MSDSHNSSPPGASHLPCYPRTRRYPALVEGTHYAPIFTDGPSDILNVTRSLLADEARAQGIAAAGQRFAARYLCPRARLLYMRRALREYKRLFAKGEMEAFVEREVWPAVLGRLPADVRAEIAREDAAAAAAPPPP